MELTFETACTLSVVSAVGGGGFVKCLGVAGLSSGVLVMLVVIAVGAEEVVVALPLLWLLLLIQLLLFIFES
jgi:hypothetical protein